LKAIMHPVRTTCLAASLLLASVSASHAQTVLVEEGHALFYLANIVDPNIPGIDWTAESYPPAAGWTPGFYGIGYEFGSGTQALITTTVPTDTRSLYTRAEFNITDVTTIQTLFLGCDYDDAYMAWINGVEVFRSLQMPVTGNPTWNQATGAHESSNGMSPDYGKLVEISGAALGALHDGVNVLVVGAWNVNIPSSDLLLVPQLTANLPPVATRGPYLQQGTETSMTIRWRTSVARDSRVSYGPAPGDLKIVVDDPVMTTEHEVMLQGMMPDTTYFYSIGSSTLTLSGDDADHFFRTSPPLGTRKPIRVWVIGDSGTANANAAAVRDAYLNIPDPAFTDVWLMLGDNAYGFGTDLEYQKAVFDMYPTILRQTPVWSTFGNHERPSASSAAESGVYYDIFTFPKMGEAGGVNSGTEAYYSFDFGNVHFINLNSTDILLGTGSVMLSWLNQDLMNTTQDWVIAFWHHPPYSKGSHDSDTEQRLIEMRGQVNPILESWGVDLVLAGHSHSYERSFLLDGYYGDSSSMLPGMLLDPGDGRLDGSGAYGKPTGGPAPNEGAVYVVAGSSGKANTATFGHPAMYIGWQELGSVVLDIDGDRLDARFINNAEVVRDYFTLIKDTSMPPVADFQTSVTSGAAPLTINFDDLSSTNTTSWSWDLDGDLIPDSSVQNPAFTYTTAGIYHVSLTVANPGGSDLDSRPDHICVAPSVPGETANLTVGANGVSINWTPASGASAYDLLKGDIVTLNGSGGDFTSSMTACLENDGLDFKAFDFDSPAPGAGFYYLVRGVAVCSVTGTYDNAGPSQPGSRDPGINSSPVACP
jgi:hypothetical protein